MVEADSLSACTCSLVILKVSVQARQVFGCKAQFRQIYVLHGILRTNVPDMGTTIFSRPRQCLFPLYAKGPVPNVLSG